MGILNSKPTTKQNDWHDYCDADVKDSLITLENLTNERGVALIVSNRYLCSDKELPSNIEDSKKMEDLFKEKGINYSPHVRNQVTYKDFIATCKYLATYEDYPPTCKAIVIYFSGHGGRGFITMEAEKGTQNTRVDMQKLRSLFNKTELAKIFFIDTCRGSGSDSGCTSNAATINVSVNNGSTTSDHCENMNSSDLDIKHAGQCSNELIAYSTSEGYVAYCDKDQGGSWTNTLVLQLRKSKLKTITSVLHNVNGLMKYKQHGSKKAPNFQTPETIDKLITDIYLWDHTQSDGNEINSGPDSLSMNSAQLPSLNQRLGNLQPPDDTLTLTPAGKELTETLAGNSNSEVLVPHTSGTKVESQPLANQKPHGDTLTLTPAGKELTQTLAGNSNSEVLVPHTSGTEVESQPLANQHLQAARSNDKTKKKLVYVIHRSDSGEWVFNELKPILTKLNIDMSTSNDFIPGKTVAQAQSDSIREAECIIVVFSKLAVKDIQSEEQIWFKFALSRAEHKNPDPSNITIIPILHGNISRTNLPASVRDITPLTANDTQFKSKIQRSIFYHDTEA